MNMMCTHSFGTRKIPVEFHLQQATMVCVHARGHGASPAGREGDGLAVAVAVALGSSESFSWPWPLSNSSSDEPELCVLPSRGGVAVGLPATVARVGDIDDDVELPLLCSRIARRACSDASPKSIDASTNCPPGQKTGELLEISQPSAWLDTNPARTLQSKVRAESVP